jgi:hypothetical protein
MDLRQEIQEMTSIKLVALLIFMLLAGQATAYDTRDEMVDDKLRILNSGNIAAQVEMLNALQWSGLTDERLYEEIANISVEEYQSGEMEKDELKLMISRVRALGYSGIDKYRNFLEAINNDGGYRKLRGNAKKAKAELDRFYRWNQKIADSDFDPGSKSFELNTFMKMLKMDDPEIQRLAARGVYHDGVTDADVLSMVAEQLKAVYQQEGLSALGQDTAAWYCKALGTNALDEYRDLLVTVDEGTPHRKIKKYADDYTD